MAERNEWRPIETAPKDGRIILLFCPKNDGLLIDHYGAGEWEDDLNGGGFWLHNLEDEPTLWAPLPDPPPPPKGSIKFEQWRDIPSVGH